MGWWKFRETCLVQAGVLLSPEEAAHAIDTYRQTFPEIPKLWRQLNRAAIRAVKNPGLVVDAAGGKIRFRRDPLWLRMRLPGGRYLWYARPLIEKGRFDTDTVTYMSVNAKTRRWERTQTYGGRLTENCISIGTSVLTDRGWLAIETVRLADRLWDGEAWVRHDGLIAKGEQDIIEIDGVGMTPDHELLTTEGWKSGASCDGLDRAPVALPDSAVSRWEHATTESPLVLPLRVRRDDDRRRGGYPQGQGEVLWLPDESPAFNAPDDAWYVEAPGLRGLALHGGPLPAADASGMAELRRAGDYGLPRVAALPSLLAGDGVNVSARADPGAHRQHARLFGGELRVAHAEGAGAEHSGQCADQHPMGPHDHRGSGGAQRYRKDDATLSPESGRARVYDVLNAGPRHRFVVAGATGPLIVHNCVQGLCRDLLVRAAMGLEQAGYQPITLIHDEVVAEPPIGHGSVGEMCEIMCALPGWARGFPLSASGARGPRYIKT
jgi:hypothetical protein